MFRPDYANPEVKRSATKRCKFCRLCHIGPCSRVKKAEFNIDGSIKHIEFFPDQDIINQNQSIYLEF